MIKAINSIRKGSRYLFRLPQRKKLTDDMHRQASWMELFLDLAFVLLMGTFLHNYLEHSGRLQLINFVFSFIGAWTMWRTITLYNAAYEENTLTHRLLMFLAMSLIILNTLYHGSFSSMEDGLSSLVGMVFMIGLRFFVMILYTHDNIFKRLKISSVTKVYLVSFSITALVGMYVLWQGRFSYFSIGLMVFAILLELFLPFLGRLFPYTSEEVPAPHRHLVTERFGLFFILTLGEVLISVADSFTHVLHEAHPKTMGEYLVFVPDILVYLFCIFAFWLIFVNTLEIKAYNWDKFLEWINFHVMIYVSILLFAAGIYKVVHYGAEDFINRLFLGGSVALFLASLTFLDLIKQPIKIGDFDGKDEENRALVKKWEREEVLVRIFSVIALLGACYFIKTATLLIGAVAFVLLWNVMFDMYIWVEILERQDDEGKDSVLNV